MAILSVRAAAERLGVSTALIYGLCSSRRIRHERHGLGRGRIKIPEEAIDEYRREVTVSPASARTTRPAARKKAPSLTNLALS